MQCLSRRHRVAGQEQCTEQEHADGVCEGDGTSNREQLTPIPPTAEDIRGHHRLSVTRGHGMEPTEHCRQKECGQGEQRAQVVTGDQVLEALGDPAIAPVEPADLPNRRLFIPRNRR